MPGETRTCTVLVGAPPALLAVKVYVVSCVGVNALLPLGPVTVVVVLPSLMVMVLALTVTQLSVTGAPRETVVALPVKLVITGGPGLMVTETTADLLASATETAFTW